MSKIITIWGSPNSGKTTLAVKIASMLSKNNNVIILSTDIIAPPIGTILPYTKEQNKSLGKLLEMVTLTQEDIFKNLITLKDNKNIAFLGYRQGENYKTYAEYTIDRANELIVNLSHIADYLIIDSSSIIQLDMLSQASLKLADEVIRLCGSDLKAISYYKSIFPILSDKSYNLSNHIKILAKIEDIEPKSITSNHYGDIFCDLPYTKEIQTQYIEGLLLNKLVEKQSLKYNESLDKLMDNITGETLENKKNKKEKKNKTKSKRSDRKFKLSFKLPTFIKKKEQDDYE
ncbi:ParA family protein [Clostridiaceae bacterium M8S5]|nr:ParA family protein [Clostridiaceae bacterium M8S5]